MSGRFSFVSLAAQAMTGHRRWPPLWRLPAPRSGYDVVIVGGGGHGLATAYYLASRHGVRDVAVIEKGWLGGGNTGRNTSVVRSNYFHSESVALYDFSLRLYEQLGAELNFNIMLSQRGVLNLIHSAHEMEMARRLANAMRINGSDAELLDACEVARLVPPLDCSPGARIPVHGGFMHRRGGVARHDAVAWGYARAADRFGVDIIQNCAVTGFRKGADGRISTVETTRGAISAGTVMLAVAGHSTVLAEMAGFQLPITSYALQAMVSEPIKPCLDRVVLSPATGLYLSQSDKGELVIGGGLDNYISYAQRGSAAVTRSTLAALAQQFPPFGRLRLLRQWAGIVDIVRDASPILGASPVPNLYLNCGWGTGGFKAIPAGGFLSAHHIVTGKPHPIAAPFGLDRFIFGKLIDEAAATGISH